jgi:hypothetical protein
MAHIRKDAKLRFCALPAAVAFLAMSGWFGGRAPVAAANPGRAVGYKTVDIDRQSRMDPVTINGVTIGDQQIQPGVSAGPLEHEPGTPFQAGDDWLRNLSIVLKNRTNKTIARAEIELFFPDTGDGISTPVTVYLIQIGRRPDIDSFSGSGKYLPPNPHAQPLLFLPGQTLAIHLTDYINEIQSVVEQKMPLSQITRCHIHRVNFFFTDGMKWGDLDGFAVPDPSHPGKFAALDRRRYFPGDPSQDWPPGNLQTHE